MPHINNQETIFIDLESQLDTNWPDGIMVFCKDTNNTWVLDNGVFVPVGGTNIFIQNGINTFTGGTTQYPTVNVTAATLNNLQVSGTSLLSTTTATSFSGGTVSGGTLYSGSTNLYNIFLQTSYSGGTNPMSGNNSAQSLQTSNSFYIGGYNTSVSKGDGSVALFLAEAYNGSFAWAGGYYNRAYIGALTGESNTQQGSIAMGPGYDNLKKGINSAAAVDIGFNYWIKSGNTSTGIYAGQQNIIGYNQAYSTIVGGSGNTINDDLVNPFNTPFNGFGFNMILNSKNSRILSGVSATTIIGGNEVTASVSDTVYVPRLNIRTIGGGTPAITLGLDSSGNVVTGTTGAGGGSAVMNGTNTYTAGTFALTSVNVSALTINTLTASGASTFTSTLSASTLSAATMISGSTNLYNIFATPSTVTGFTPETIYVAISDETTQITTGTNKVTIYAPYAFTLSDVKVSLAQSGSAISTFNVKLTGTTIFSTKPTIDANEFTTATAATPKVITATTIPVDSKITFDVDGIGTGCAGAKVYLMGYRL